MMSVKAVVANDTAPDASVWQGSQVLVLYDAQCGFCRTVVQHLRAADRNRRLWLVPRDGPTGQQFLAIHPECKTVDALIAVHCHPRTGRQLITSRSSAMLIIARRLGGWWSLLWPLSLVPRPLRDWAYDWVARHRHKLSPP